MHVIADVALVFLGALLEDAYTRGVDKLLPGWRRRVAKYVQEVTGMPGAARGIRALLESDGFWHQVALGWSDREQLPANWVDGFANQMLAADPYKRLEPTRAAEAVRMALAALWQGLWRELPEDMRLDLASFSATLQLAGSVEEIKNIVERLESLQADDTGWLVVLLEGMAQPIQQTQHAIDDLEEQVNQIAQAVSSHPRWRDPLPLDPGDESAAMLASHPIVPGSRDAELATVLNWLDDDSNGLGVLIEGDVFRGKTTFMCELLRRLRRVRPVVSFFNVRDAGHQRTRCLVSLNSQLIGLLNPGFSLAPENELVQQFHALLDIAAPALEGLVVVVDALDEASDHKLLVEALSYRPAGVSLIAASRPHPPLPRRHLLLHRRLPLREIPEAVERKERAEAWIRGVVESSTECTLEVVATFVASKGPISTEDVADLWDMRPEAVRRIIEPHREWFAAPDRFHQIRLGHEHLSATLLREDAVRRLDMSDRFRVWAQKYAAEGWSVDKSPRYLLRYWPEHCRDPIARAELVCSNWLPAARARLTGPHSVIGAARNAFTQLADIYIDTGRHLPLLIRTASVAGRLRAGVDAIDPALISALLDAGYAERSYNYALASHDPDVVLVAMRHPSLEGVRAGLLRHLQWLARDVMTDVEARARAWVGLVPLLADPSAAYAEARELVGSDPGISSRATSVWLELIPCLAAVDHAEIERVIREDIQDPWDKAMAWVALLPHLTHPAAAFKEAAQVIQDGISDPWMKARAWIALVPHDPHPHSVLACAIEAVCDITIPVLCLRAATMLVPYLQDPSSVLAGVKVALGDDPTRSVLLFEAWLELLPHVAADDPEWIERIIRDTITDPDDATRAWAAFVPYSPAPVAALAELERIIHENIAEPWDVAETWAILIQHVAVDDPAEAERIIREEITRLPLKAPAWTALIPHLADPSLAIAEAEWMIRREASASSKVELWADLIPYASDPAAILAEVEWVIRQELHDSDNFNEKDRAWITLIPHIGTMDRAKAVQIIRDDITAPECKAEAWVALSSHLPDPAFAITRAERILRDEDGDPLGRMLAWLRLAPMLARFRPGDAVQIVRDEIVEPLLLNEAWLAVIPHLAAVELEAATQVIRDEIKAPLTKALCWAALVPQLGETALAEAEFALYDVKDPREAGMVWVDIIPTLAVTDPAKTEVVIRELRTAGDRPQTVEGSGHLPARIRRLIIAHHLAEISGATLQKA